MTTRNHTQGPWNRVPGDPAVFSCAGVICKRPPKSSARAGHEDWEANANLIAAAPELLEALEELGIAFCSRHGSFPLDRENLQQRQWNDAMSKARAVIKKARTW